MPNIVGTFDSAGQADEVVTELTRSGIDQERISLLMSDATRRSTFGGNDVDGRAAKAGVTGATIGGGLGALLAGLTAVGALAVPGGLLAVGPVIAALSGASAGALVGGLGAALVQAGIDEGEVERYQTEIEAGKSVVVVHAEDEDEVAVARQAFRRISLAA